MNANPFPFLACGVVTAVIVGFGLSVAVDDVPRWDGLVTLSLFVALTARLAVLESRLSQIEGTSTAAKLGSGFLKRLQSYERRLSPNHWFGNIREEYVVLARVIILGLAGAFSYPWPGWFHPIHVLSLLGIYLLLDGLVVTTVHAFGSPPPGSVFRFVALNLVVFATLPLGFVLMVAPMAASFTPHLDYRMAFELGLSATMFAEGLSTAQTETAVATMLVFVGNLVGLYFVGVVLVSAVSRIKNDSSS